MPIKVVDSYFLKMLRQAQHEIIYGLQPEPVEGFSLICFHPQP